MADPGRNANALATTRGMPPVVKTATFTATANNTLVSAVSGAKITVTSLMVSSNNGAAIVNFADSGGTKWSGWGNFTHTAPAGGYIFQCVSGAALNFTLSAAANTCINVTYIEDKES